MLQHRNLSELKISSNHNLAVKNPELTKEWHPTMNGNLTPFQVTPGSRRKVWWMCSREHEWEATLANRTSGTGCPYCANEKRGGILRKAVLKRSGSLEDKYPELAEEWHPTMNGNLTPFQVTPGSRRKVWWMCSREHEWEATLASRTRGTSCPYCNRESRRCGN